MSTVCCIGGICLQTLPVKSYTLCFLDPEAQSLNRNFARIAAKPEVSPFVCKQKVQQGCTNGAMTVETIHQHQPVGCSYPTSGRALVLVASRGDFGFVTTCSPRFGSKACVPQTLLAKVLES